MILHLPAWGGLVSSLYNFRTADSHRLLCTRLDPNVIPLNWKTPHPATPTSTHLPVDAMARLTLHLLGGLSFSPLINSPLLPDLPLLPSDNVMETAYSSIKAKALLLMLDSCRLSHPPLPYYSFHLSLTPHPFMGLGKFIAGRINQMRV